MENKALYILDPHNFNGSVEGTICNPSNMVVDFVPGSVNFEEYKTLKKNPSLVALDWETFEEKHLKPYLRSLCKPFQECDEERYYDGLECLPPKRWTIDKDKGISFFFVGECQTYDLYRCFVKKGAKFYTALRSIHSKDEDLFKMSEVAQ